LVTLAHCYLVPSPYSQRSSVTSENMKAAMEGDDSFELFLTDIPEGPTVSLISNKIVGFM